jgi:uncharacterized protein (DUF305 family)
MHRPQSPAVTRLALTTAALLAGLGTGAIAVAQPHGASSAAAASSMSGHGGSSDMHSKMQSGMQQMQQMKPSGDIDRDFATMMRVHHQQALDMARSEIEHGKSAELKAMARKIIKDQTKEIAQLDAWLKKRN